MIQKLVGWAACLTVKTVIRKKKKKTLETHDAAYLEFYLFKGRGRRLKSSRLSWAISEVLHQPGSQKTGRGLGERKERGGEEKKKGNIHSVRQPWKQCSTHLKDQKGFGLMFTIRKSHKPRCSPHPHLVSIPRSSVPYYEPLGLRRSPTRLYWIADWQEMYPITAPSSQAAAVESPWKNWWTNSNTSYANYTYNPNWRLLAPKKKALISVSMNN